VSGEKIIKKLSFGGKNYKKVKFRGRSGGGSGGYPGNRDFLRIRGRSGSVREGSGRVLRASFGPDPGFRNFQELSRGQFRASFGPDPGFRNFQELSGTFPRPVSGQFRAGPRFQELSGTFRNFQELLSRAGTGFRNFQELSGTFKRCPGRPETEFFEVSRET